MAWASNLLTSASILTCDGMRSKHMQPGVMLSPASSAGSHASFAGSSHVEWLFGLTQSSPFLLGLRGRPLRSRDAPVKRPALDGPRDPVPPLRSFLMAS